MTVHLPLVPDTTTSGVNLSLDQDVHLKTTLLGPLYFNSLVETQQESAGV